MDCFAYSKGLCTILQTRKGGVQYKLKCDDNVKKDCRFFKTIQQFEDDKKKAAKDYYERTGLRR